MWHVSVARLNPNTPQRPLAVAQWPGAVMAGAKELQRRVLLGAGGLGWQATEIGQWAIHLRRHLSAAEMTYLYKTRPSCPVFTHGAAMQHVVQP